MSPVEVGRSRDTKHFVKFAVFSAFIAALIAGCGDPPPSETPSSAQPASVPQPSDREVRLRTAANAGDPQALIELGWAYSFGDDETWYGEEAKNMAAPYIIQGIHKNPAEAKRLILLSAQKGNVTAMGITANNFFWDHDYPQSVYWGRKASAQGNKTGIELLQTLRTIVDSDPLGTYTAEQRQQIKAALDAPEYRSSAVSLSSTALLSFDWDHAPFSGGVAIFLSAEASHLPTPPIRKDVIYSAAQLQISQKVDGGYLVRMFDPFGQMGPCALAFVETDREFESDQVLPGFGMRYIGPYQYTGLDGFAHSIDHFQLQPEATSVRPSSESNERPNPSVPPIDYAKVVFGATGVPQPVPVGPTAVAPATQMADPVRAVAQERAPAAKSGELSSIGPMVVDARWNDFGPYLHRMTQTLEAQWEQMLLESRVYPNSGNKVSVKFVMNTKGSIVRIEKVDASVGTSDAASRICVSAIFSCAPYGDWSKEMISALGTQQEITFTFAYQ